MRGVSTFNERKKALLLPAAAKVANKANNFRLGVYRIPKTDRKKWIARLSKTLDDAEKSGNVSQTKIDNIRKKFDLDKPISVDREEMFTLNTKKGKSNNAT